MILNEGVFPPSYCSADLKLADPLLLTLRVSPPAAPGVWLWGRRAGASGPPSVLWASPHRATVSRLALGVSTYCHGILHCGNRRPFSGGRRRSALLPGLAGPPEFTSWLLVALLLPQAPPAFSPSFVAAGMRGDTLPTVGFRLPVGRGEKPSGSCGTSYPTSVPLSFCGHHVGAGNRIEGQTRSSLFEILHLGCLMST